MKILVTGANGLLGQKLSLLLDKDAEVQLVPTARSPLTYSVKGRFHRLDVTVKEDVQDSLSFIRPDVVIHTAAMTQVDQCEIDQPLCWLNNVTAVENVVNACNRVGSHLIHVSTDFIFDGKKGPLDENAIPNPISYYGQSKLAGEELVKKATIDWAILRTVLVYGVTQDMSRSNIVLWVKKSLEEGKEINVVNDQWRTPTLAEDLAMGCMLAVTKKAKGIYNISGEEMMTPYDIAIRTAEFFKLDKNLIKKTDSTRFTQAAKRPPRTGFIIDKAKRELGYQPHSFEEGLGMIRSFFNKK